MKSITEKILLTITIDTECDHDSNWARSNPIRFESVYDGIPNKLQPLFNDVGAVPTYLLTVEVLEDSQCIDILCNLNGVYEFGSHLHSAFIEPEKKYQNYAGIDSPDFQCNDLANIEFKKLQNLSNLFKSKMGYPAKTFRAGRFGAGANTVSSLHKLGYQVDTSVTPHLRWSEPRGSVDFRKAGEQPYFPKNGSIINPDKFKQGALLEMPVTMKKRLFRGPRWFRPWLSSVEQMKRIIQYHRNKYSAKKIININMMFHSMEVIAKATPYPQSDTQVKKHLDDIHKILIWCKSEGIGFRSAKKFYSEYIKSL